MAEYQDIGQHVKLVADPTTHDVAGDFDQDYLKKQRITVPETADRQQTIDVFNQVAQQNNLKPLRDPTGYMKQENNVYDEIHNTYTKRYEIAREQGQNGTRRGGGYGEDAQLRNINKVVRRDMKMFLPKNVRYTDLRFTPASDSQKRKIDEMAQARVQLTLDHTIKRTIKGGNGPTFRRDSDTFQERGKAVARDVAGNFGVKMAPPAMSQQKLLENSHNDKESLLKFAKQVTNPEEIEPDESGMPTASFNIDKSDRNFLKFVNNNKDYLKDYDFEIKKKAGKLNVSWTSQQVQKMYNERSEMSLEGLNDLNEINEAKSSSQNQL